MGVSVELDVGSLVEPGTGLGVGLLVEPMTGLGVGFFIVVEVVE